MAVNQSYFTGTARGQGPSTTATYEEPSAQAMRRGFLESAFGLARTPTPVAVQQYAGLDPFEMQARQLAGGLGGFTPYIQQGGQMMQEGLGVARQGQGALAGAQDMYGQGTGLVGQGTGLYGLGTQLTGQASDYYRPGAASSFYNPYEQDVVQQTLSDLQERSAKQGVADRSQAVSRGAFGGSRGRLMEQERERAFGRGAAEAIGGIRSRGFEGARSAAMTAGQGLGQLGGQLGSFGSGLGQLGGQLGQFGSGLSNVAGQYGNLGTGIAGLGTGFANLGTTGQSNLLKQINAFEGLGRTGRGIQNQMYGAQFDAANRLSAEPTQRLKNLQSMLGLLPTTRSTTTFNPIANTYDPMQGIMDLLGGGNINLPGVDQTGVSTQPAGQSNQLAGLASLLQLFGGMG
jgi:hypothetical protein